MGLEVGEPFGVVARPSVVDAYFESEDTFDKVHDLVETPLRRLRDVFIHDESPNLGFDNIVIPNPLDHSHVSPMFLQPSPSPKYYIDVPINNSMICDTDLGCENNVFEVLGGNTDNFVSLAYFSGFNAYLGPYYIYLEELA